MRTALAALLLALWLPAGAGRAAEPAGAVPDPATAPADSQIDAIRLAELPAATVRSDLVAVVRITAIAEVADNDQVWGGREGLLDAAFAKSQFNCQPVTRQVSAEVEQMLKGDKDLTKVEFRLATAKVKLGKAPPAEILVVSRWYNSGKYGARRARALTYARYQMARDQKLLVFLKELKTVKDGDKVTARECVPADLPVEGAPGAALAEVQKTLKVIADWEKPARPPPEEEAAARKLIAELGSADFPTREAATKALVARGLPVKALIDEAVGNSDVEVRERAKQILEAIKPAVLKPRPAADITEEGDGGE